MHHNSNYGIVFTTRLRLFHHGYLSFVQMACFPDWDRSFPAAFVLFVFKFQLTGVIEFSIEFRQGSAALAKHKQSRRSQAAEYRLTLRATTPTIRHQVLALFSHDGGCLVELRAERPRVTGADASTGEHTEAHNLIRIYSYYSDSFCRPWPLFRTQLPA